MATKQRGATKYRDLPYGAGSVRQRGDGWEARWTEGDQRKSKQFATADEAHALLYKRWQERRTGTYRPPSELTIKNVLEAWLERHRDSWAASTYHLNESYVRLYLLDEFGAMLAHQLAPDRVQHWIDRLRRNGTNPPTIQTAVRVLGQAFRDARVLRQVPDDPTKGVTRPKVRPKPRATWTSEEVARVNAALADDPCWLAVYRLALSTGLRPGEMMALQWGDIDLDSGIMTVRRTLTKGATKTLVVGATTKTGVDRAVAIPAPAVAALRQWKRVQAELRIAAQHWDSRSFVLTGATGSHLFPSTWHRRHKEIIERAAVSTIPLHSLRHTFATIAFEQGIHPKIVQEMLGHKHISMTLDLYSHLSIDLQAAASAALGEHLFGGDILRKRDG